MREKVLIKEIFALPLYPLDDGAPFGSRSAWLHRSRLQSVRSGAKDKAPMAGRAWANYYFYQGQCALSLIRAAFQGNGVCKR